MNVLRELRKWDISSEDILEIKIPMSFNKTFEEQIDETVRNAVNQSTISGKLSWNETELKIKSILFATAFDKTATKIIQQLKTLLNDPEVFATAHIIMAGEFSESLFLQRKVKEEFPYVEFLMPDNPRLFMLKGAVILGHVTK